MTFDHWFDHETSLPGNKRPLAELAWNAARREAAKECVEICNHIKELGYFQPVTSKVAHEIIERFGLEI